MQLRGLEHSGTRAFVEKFRSLAAVVAPEVGVEVPQAELSKADVVRIGAQLNAPLLLRTYSCMRGRPLHCGTCLQCRSRREAFRSAGALDVDYDAASRRH